MPRQSWLLHQGLPVVEVLLREPFTGFLTSRTLLADTGAGSRFAPFDLILPHRDGQQFGERLETFAGASGAIRGQFPVFTMTVEIPSLSVLRQVHAVIVPVEAIFSGVDGFACFRFLNSFTYGNFGDANSFGLETP